MSDKFVVEIITPDQSILKTETNEVTLPSFEGQMGILKDHIPLITFLRPGIVVIKNQDEKKYYVEEGTVEFSKNNLLILSSTVKNLKEISKENVIKMIDDAKKNIANDETNDKEKYQLSHKIDTLENIN